MTAPILALFNNKGGVGKTSLAYHLAWSYADSGLKILAVDGDPQANLSTQFLDEDRLTELVDQKRTVYSAIQPVLDGEGSVQDAHLEAVDEQIDLLVGDVALSRAEDELSHQWLRALDETKRALNVVSVLWQLMTDAAKRSEADLVLLDLGPSLGAINRAALLATDFIIVPLAPDLFSLRGLENLGPTVEAWRRGWQKRRDDLPEEMELPSGTMRALGYVVQQHSVRLDRPVRAYETWLRRIPGTFARTLGNGSTEVDRVEDDPSCLGLVKHYRSLIPMAQDARKPIFHLKVADGALGAHLQASRAAGQDFRELAESISRKLEEAQTADRSAA